MTYQEAKAYKATLEASYFAASKALQTFPKSDIGLTPDAVKFSPEFRAAKAKYTLAHNMLRDFNSWFMAAFKAEIRAERNARFA